MPAGNTYEAIATQTLGSAAASVTFSSIPSTYTDLVLVCNLISTSATANIVATVNGDTGNNYSQTYLSGDGSAANSARNSNIGSMNFVWTGGSLNNTVGNAIIQFMNYSNTVTNKTVLARYNVAAGEATATVNLWRNTAAINSITVSTTSNTWATGTTVSLYGIKAA
jgi:hypothetical protein